MAAGAQRILQRALLGEALDGATGTAVFVWNEDRNYVAVNDEACRLVGLPRQEIIGMPVGELSPDRADRDIARTLDEPFVRGGSSFTRRSGETIELDWITMHTTVAGLDYMISLVWPASA
jgi:PAS domain S-box-containing protein